MNQPARFEIGQWVTCEAPNGWKISGQVVSKTEKPGTIEYTLHQFPDDPIIAGAGVSNEAITGDPIDILGELQLRAADAVIAHQRVALAAVSGDYIAWMAYPPTLNDDPAEYAPYWTRLTQPQRKEP